MYKVLLVDDEVLTREAISQNIPWESMGFTLIGTAGNGQEALKMVERDPPDLVLTDICMPVMDGIALSGELHDHYPETSVVIISGYDDFEYAKQALRFGVSNYLLKPITSRELTDELVKIKEKITGALAKREEFIKVQQHLRKNVPTLRSHFLSRLTEGTYMKNDIEAQVRDLEISLKGNVQAMVMFESETSADFLSRYPQEGEDLVHFAVANIAGEVAENHEQILFFQNDQNQSYLIFAEDNEESLDQLIQKNCRKVMTAIRQFMGVRVYVLVGETVSGVRNWKHSYRSLLTAREGRFLLKNQDFIYAKMKGAHDRTEGKEFTPQTEQLVRMIKLNQVKEMEGEVSEIFDKLRTSGNEKRQLLVTIQRLVLQILMELSDYAPDKVSECYKDEFTLRLAEFRYLSDMEEQFLNACQELADEIARHRDGASQIQAMKAMEYIKKNYMNPEISLNAVCDYLCVSTSYFSAIFKNSTGETFIEALTRIRIGKARDLLECSDMKTYEVALKTGYQDPHYFSSIFKKRVGMTPTEYVKRIKKGKWAHEKEVGKI